MPSHNHTILVGNLTADPEVRVTTAGKPVTTFTVAVNRPASKEQENGEKEVLFMPCVVFGKAAEASGKYLKKGDPVLVTGRLRENKWDQDGSTRSRIVLIAGGVQFLKANGKREENVEEIQESGAETEDIPL
jgi:single-strand DNA-binding protein